MIDGQLVYGDIGTLIEITIKNNGVAVDVSDATEKYLIFQKPSGQKISFPASFSTDGNDGKIGYTTKLGDINEVGTWLLQGQIKLPSGQWTTQQLHLRVDARIVPTVINLIANSSQHAHSVAEPGL